MSVGLPSHVPFETVETALVVYAEFVATVETPMSASQRQDGFVRGVEKIDAATGGAGLRAAAIILAPAIEKAWSRLPAEIQARTDWATDFVPKILRRLDWAQTDTFGLPVRDAVQFARAARLAVGSTAQAAE